jgi:hypothetical protein
VNEIKNGKEKRESYGRKTKKGVRFARIWLN